MWERPEQQNQLGKRKPEVNELICHALLLSMDATDSCTMKDLSLSAAEQSISFPHVQVWCLDIFLL